jgi:endo-1,4-beta-mannosidase
MWRSFDAGVVRKELLVLREHGLNVTRSFFYLPDFMPASDIIDEAFVERYGRFLDLCGEVGISTVPTFIVGHMSGENWDVPWRAGGTSTRTDGCWPSRCSSSETWPIVSKTTRLWRGG